MLARRTDIKIIYESKDISEDLMPYLKGFSYVDNASGEADAISIGIADFDRKWVNDWVPEKTDKIEASLMATNWRNDGDFWETKCGKFSVDNFSFNGPPVTLQLDAISTPVSTGFNCTEHTKTWEKATVKKIASKISKDAGIDLYYEADEIPIGIIEQSEKTDMSFLSELCDSYGLAMKIYADKLIIFDEEAYEAKGSVTTIDYTDVIDWSANRTMTQIFDLATVKYEDPSTGESMTKTFTPKKSEGKQTTRELQKNIKAHSVSDAQRKAKAAFRKKCKEERTMSLKLSPRSDFVASNCVNVKGFGTFDGKYYVDKITHEVSGAYNMQVELHEVLEV